VDELADIDHRPSLFVGLTPENLARHAAMCSRTAATPPTVANLLAEARRTFVGAAACYDNFASSAFKALQAAELALRVLMNETQSRTTLGQLLRRPDVETLLSSMQLAWFREFALHFRNRLAHPDDSMAMTPGMAEPFVRTAHDIVAELFPDARHP
jgi:hypothetical protein